MTCKNQNDNDGTVGSLAKHGGASTSRLEQPHKQERRHTLTQNLKAMGLWVLLLIRCSTFTLLSDVGHITHLYTTTLPLKCEFINSSYSPFKGSSYLLCIVVAGFSANGPTLLVPPLWLFVQTGWLPRSQTGALIPLLGH